jgi:hypothetical protein
MMTSAPASIDQNNVEAWPAELLAVLEREQAVFLDWDLHDAHRYSGQRFSCAASAVEDILKRYSLRGWHCSRLTTVEIQRIQREGMRLPDAEMLHRRIDEEVATGTLLTPIASELKARNQAGDPYRAGRLWFCFYPPREAGESGIERFFRHWGGEALYNSHEDDPVTSAALKDRAHDIYRPRWSTFGLRGDAGMLQCEYRNDQQS